MKKTEARQVYQRMLIEYAGMDQISAKERSDEEVLSGKKLPDGSSLIKINLDNHTHRGPLFEHISFRNNKIEYRTLVKKGSKFYLWSDSGICDKEFSL